MKKSQLYYNLFLVFLCLWGLNLYAQDNTALSKLNAFSQHFSIFAKDYPQEKVYLHFDNTAYYLGETIWFKGYVVRADGNSLSQLSKVLYVELINAEGYVVETKKLKIENGQCHGDFKPTVTNYAGFYEIRAYTRYMLNFGPCNYYSRVFPVYDKPKNDGEYIPLISGRPFSQRIPQIRPEYKQKGSLEIQFLPEGGNLVAGLNSRVAFKAMGKDGENAVVSGAVYNEQNEKMADIATEYQGMGVFDLKPDSGKYTARVQYNNKEYKFELPSPLPKGHTITVDNLNDEKIDIQIQRNLNTPSEPLGMSISCRGILYGFEKIDIGKDSTVSLSFPKKMLPTGVSQITLFNASGEVLSERLVFVNHHSQLKIGMTQSKLLYQPFEKVDMGFQLKDMRGNPIETTFSVAVRDATTSSTNPFGDNILTNLLLSSEVKGYIEHPDYYFESDDAARQKALDLLLMTQGWSRYSWKQMAGIIPFKVKQPLEKGLLMDGSVVSLLLKKKKKDVNITMILLTDSLSQRGECKTDSAGDFNFALQDFKGNAKLILQSKQKDKRMEMYIKLNRQLSPEFKTYSFAELNVPQYFKAGRDTVIVSDSIPVSQDDDLEKYLPKNNDKLPMDKRINLLKGVTVKEKHRPIKVSINYDVVKEMDKRLDTNNWLPATIDIFLNFTCKYYHDGMYKNKHVLFVLDDSKQVVSDINSVLTGSEAPETKGETGGKKSLVDRPMPYLDEIESISFIEDYNSMFRIYKGDINPYHTVIALIHCKKNYQKEPYGIRNTIYEGYTYSKEFFNPQYDKVILPNEKDYRRTLYWNPDVRTDKDGKATISFYNNSSCKTMNVSAETVTERGIIGVLNN